MTVTILVPVYGAEKYIAECVESLFRQTYSDIEYIFCDDCTQDRSIEILMDVISKYPERKSHVHIIKNDQNKGIGGTRAHLISEVKTETFFFVDSDDILPENAISILSKRMDETGADIIEGAFCYYRSGEIFERNLPSHDKSSRYIKKVQVCDLLRHQLWGRLYKTTAISKIPDLFVEGIDMAEDYCATTRLAAVTTRAWTDDVVYLYRVEQQSFFIREMSDKNIRSYLKATKMVYDFYRKRGPLALSVEIGILRAYRQTYREKGMTTDMVNTTVQYTPEHIAAKLLLKILTSKHIPYYIKNLLYKLTRAYAVYIA